MSESLLGEIRMVSFNYAPVGWALCNGQLLQISQNQQLFSIIGTQYGGDGIKTFALPDLRGRVPVHVNGEIKLGSSGGEVDHTLVQAEMPTHTHTALASSNQANSALPTNMYWAVTASDAYGATADAAMTVDSVGKQGANQPHENMAPYLTINFIISLRGDYPYRG